MKRLRLGTRGSALARAQTRIIIEALRTLDRSIDCEEVVIATAGDLQPDMAIGEGWPLGGFTSAIEQALLAGRIDLAVHSLKDLPTTLTSGLMVAANPQREAAHDVLITREPMTLANVPRGLRIGTSSPRRAAQLQRFLGAEPVPMRGNVTTRLDKLTRENLGGIVLAAAGLRRLGLSPSNAIDLPVEAFVPAPGQGAMAVQCRADDRAIVALARQLNDSPTARAVGAERAFLAQVGVGCATPVAALAHVTEAGMVHLHSQLFSDDGKRMAEAREEDRDGESLGRAMAMRLRSDLEQRP